MKKKVWALLDDRMGSVGQVRGVAQALDNEKYDIIEKRVEYNAWAKLPNVIRGSSLLGLLKESKKTLKSPWPHLVISGSRRTAPIARWIKKQSKGKTKIVQLMHVGSWGVKDFDLVFVPEHDRHKKSFSNFIYITGSPHRVTKKALKEAEKLWIKEFQDLPKPLTAVIVGGSIKGHPFTVENAINLSHAIKKFKEKTGGSILFTNSRRTGYEADKILLEQIKKFPHYNYLWGSPGVNPIMGFWACADNIIVTGDSVSMCSESCGTGKPVLVFTDSWLTDKHNRFVQSLYDGKYATSLSDDKADAFKPKHRLDPSQTVAENINNLFK